jgi:starch phosphorylase
MARDTGIQTRSDYHKGMDAGALALSIGNHVKYSLAKERARATPHDRYTAVARAVRDRLVDRWMSTQAAYAEQDVKRVYYLSMEYLPGRTLWNAVVNLGLADAFPRAMQVLAMNADEIVEQEPDTGLGNGGLGRLASCFLDSMATLQLPATGYGLRYQFGMFRQALRGGYQVEEPDHWSRLGSPWEITRPERSFPIRLYGRVVPNDGGREWTDGQQLLAIACDVPIPGFANNTVNNLRLWSATDSDLFDFEYFNSGDYIKAVERNAQSETITKILYPNDKVYVGLELRLKQEYFLASASLQDIVRRYKEKHASFDEFADKVAIQINDTHPAVAVAELMRILVDLEGVPWEKAWDTTVKVFGYTNHTLMPEALEKWAVALFGHVLPRHLEIIYDINHRFLYQVDRKWPGDGARMSRMSIVEEGDQKYIRMAHLAVVGSHSVNGVSKLHTKLLQSRLFPDFAELFPGRFNAKTNGITPRRWLIACNPGLTSLITSKIGDGWTHDLNELRKLEPHAKDAAFRKAWRDVKRANKERLAALVEKLTRLRVPVDSMFDVQVKRMHEYKRQLMNILRVIDLYGRMREPSGASIPARTVVFGGKAAPGYEMAKLQIKLITSVADVVNRDPALRDRLNVVFLEDYRVTLAETIIPGADLSEQISTAGMEASGTGNMKFALNGALTIGTLDGANVEIKDAVGDGNIFIFGCTAEEAGAMQSGGYDPRREIEQCPRLRAVLDMLSGGYFSPDDRFRFRPIVDGLTGRDPFLVCRDFASYVACHERVDKLWRDPEKWTEMSILNTAGMGPFSSDRTVGEYAREIWGVKATPIVLG